MSEEQEDLGISEDRNQTKLDGTCQGNWTEDRLDYFQEYLNVTLPDANATEEIDSFYFYETEQFTVLWLLFAMIVVGNIAVLIGLLWGKRRKTRMDFFIKQLALADLLVGLISVLTDIIWRTTVTWHAGNVACKLIRFMQALVTYSSTYVLVALSIDRYDAITRPMNFTGRWEDPVLDRPGIADALEDLHEPGQLHPLYSPDADNRGLLCCDRGHYMVAGRGVASRTFEGHQKSLVQRSDTQGESEDSQDDPGDSVRIYTLLEPVHSVRPPPGLRVRAGDPDQHRRGHLHSEPDASELRCQSDHILSVQHLVLQDHTEHAGDLLGFWMVHDESSSLLRRRRSKQQHPDHCHHVPDGPLVQEERAHRGAALDLQETGHGVAGVNLSAIRTTFDSRLSLAPFTPLRTVTPLEREYVVTDTLCGPIGKHLSFPRSFGKSYHQGDSVVYWVANKSYAE